MTRGIFINRKEKSRGYVPEVWETDRYQDRELLRAKSRRRKKPNPKSKSSSTQPKKKVYSDGFIMPAKFKGYCSVCKKEIIVGQPIKKSKDKDGWIHSMC